jgi:hypothetical protein
MKVKRRAICLGLATIEVDRLSSVLKLLSGYGRLGIGAHWRGRGGGRAANVTYFYFTAAGS